MINYSTFHLVRNWCILAQVIICDFWCFSQRDLHGVHSVHSPSSQRCAVRRGEHMQCPCVCVLFVSSTSGIVFSQSDGAITDDSQSAKNIEPYFKSKRYIEYHGHRKPVLILPNTLSKRTESERAREINFCRGWDSNP